MRKLLISITSSLHISKPKKPPGSKCARATEQPSHDNIDERQQPSQMAIRPGPLRARAQLFTHRVKATVSIHATQKLMLRIGRLLARKVHGAAGKSKPCARARASERRRTCAKRTCARARMHTHTHAHARACARSRMHTLTHAHAHACTMTRASAHVGRRGRTRANAHARKDKCT
eukprot:4253177-Pleurochrysis_carterae.AAC.1